MKKKDELLIATAVLGFAGGIAAVQSPIMANDDSVNTQQEIVAENTENKIEGDEEPEIVEELDNIQEDQKESDSNKEENRELSPEQGNDLKNNLDNANDISQDSMKKDDNDLKSELSSHLDQSKESQSTNDIVTIQNKTYYADGVGNLHEIQQPEYITYSVMKNGVQTTLKGVVLKTGESFNSSINADFIILQASSGYKGTNANFNTIAQQIIDSGKLLAMMHEARTGTKEDGHMEAFHFYQVVKNYVGKGLPILHISNAETGPLWADEFMDSLYGLSGMKGIIWTTQNVINNGDWDAIKEQQDVRTDVTTVSMTKSEWNNKIKTSLPTGTSEMYRLYNPYSGEHLYTNDSKERDDLVKIGWRYESIGWTAPNSGVRGYRLYNPYSGDHLYTLNASERDNLVKIGWRYEGVKYYSDPKKATAIYRLFNPYTKVGTHHYTTNQSEYNELVKYGWRQEGIAWYGLLSTLPRNVVPAGNYIRNEMAFNNTGAKITGVQKINNNLYYFNPNNNGKKQYGNGKVNIAQGVIWITSNGGALKTGWDGNQWYDVNTGVQAVNKIVSINGLNYRFDGNGNWNNQIDVEIQKLCVNVYNQVGRNLRALYDWTYRNIRYATLPIPLNPPAGYSREQNYAIKGLKERQGNCYCYAATFAALARNIGHNIRFVEGGVRRTNGTVGSHGWTVITINGNQYICDPEGQIDFPTVDFYMQPINKPKISYVF